MSKRKYSEVEMIGVDHHDGGNLSLSGETFKQQNRLGTLTQNPKTDPKPEN